MAKRKMNIKICGLTAFLIIVGWLLLPVTQAGAETMKGWVTNYIIEIQAIPVGDVQGHVLVMFKREGVALLNGQVGTQWVWGTADLTNAEGLAQGYAMVTYVDGSTTRSTWKNTIQWAPDRKVLLFTGTGEWTSGTGRFEGIKGSFSVSGKQLNLYSKDTKADVYQDLEGTYTLPTK